MRPILLTMGLDSEYETMVRDNEPRHRAYCERWDIEYKAYFATDVQPSASMRIAPVLQALESGHSHVFWIDADAAIIKFDTDLRDSVTDKNWLGMRRCDVGWSGRNWHWQTGVFYIKNCEESIRFIRRVHDMTQCGGNDQTSMLELIWDDPTYKHIVNELDCSWNYMPHLDKVDRNPPIVVAFHGVAHRRAKMHDWTSQYPYDGIQYDGIPSNPTFLDYLRKIT
jgi:hypothetical protein